MWRAVSGLHSIQMPLTSANDTAEAIFLLTAETAAGQPLRLHINMLTHTLVQYGRVAVISQARSFASAPQVGVPLLQA